MYKYNKDNPLRVFTAFAGYDSQCLALDRLKNNFPDFDYKLVGWSEIDKHAIIAHDALFADAKELNYGDICKISWEEVPDFDLFTYSFPCTDISNAGLQQGLSRDSGTRSSLLWECEKAIRIKRPKYLLMENVKALVQKKFIKDYHAWVSLLDSYGYSSWGKVLNASQYGIPQNRERIFLVSIRIDGLESFTPEFQYHFPKPFPLEKRLKDVLEDHVDEKYYLSDKMLEYFNRVNDDKSHGHNFTPNDGGGDCLCNKNGTRQPSGRQLFQVGRVNRSQDGLVVSSDGIAPCHSAGHGNPRR